MAASGLGGGPMDAGHLPSAIAPCSFSSLITIDRQGLGCAVGLLVNSGSQARQEACLAPDMRQWAIREASPALFLLVG